LDLTATAGLSRTPVSEGPIALRLARFALDLDFAALPDSMVGWGKEVLLDTIGCAIAGYDGAPAESARRVFAALGGAAQSTVIGGGQRLPSPAAAWINGTMARYEDLNDTYPQPGRVGHFSEVIPTALAVAELSGAGGAQLLAAIVAGYEVLAATTFHGPQVGVGFATFGAIASPVVAGTLLGLSERQIASAVGISLSSNVTLVTWLGEARGSMLKASTWSANAHHGIIAAMLAQQGFTAPETAIETYLRTVEVSHPEVQLPPPGRFTVPGRNMLKRYAAQMSTAGPIELVLTLARRHEIGPEDIEEIIVHSTAELARYAAGAGAQRPVSREAADHSLPYVLAVALIEGDVLPAQYAHRQWEDPRMITLMDKVTCRVDPQLDRRAQADGSMPARVEMRAAGHTFSAELENPRGHAANPMGAGEVREKFRRLVSARLSDERQDAVIRAVADIDKAAAVTPLLAATVFDIKPPSV
jgi:2-methylcitrate dehydratase